MGRVRVGAMMLVLAGCGGGSISGSGPEFATAPDASVLTPAVRMVTLGARDDEVLAPGASASAACTSTVRTSYTLSLDTKHLTLSGRCAQGDPSLPESWVPDVADVSLTAPQFETLIALVGAVTVSARRECGADAPERELHVESKTAALIYGDDFYGCRPRYDYYVAQEPLDSFERAIWAIDQ